MNQILQKSKRKMYKLAYFDEITQMPNERYFNAKIIKKMKKSEDFSIIVFEMERLESIKASLGTYYSEEMLKMAAKKLNTQFSERFVIGKLRGDQFAILVSGERDGIISPPSIAFKTSKFTLLFFASSSSVIFCFSLILLIFKANSVFFSIFSPIGYLN